MELKKQLWLLAGSMVLFSCALTKTTSKKIITASTVASAKTDTTTKKNVKPYKEVITDKAITSNGLFKVHKVEDRYYFEIVDSLLNKDILIVNRISKAATGVRPVEGLFGYAGDYIGENVVQFTKGPN